MKLINNQDITLYKELISALNEDSEVRICTSYLSIPAIFELSDALGKVKSIEILVDNKNIGQDIRFAYDNAESKNYFKLKSKYQAEKIRELVQTKCSFRAGSVGGQKFILVKNKKTATCFAIAPNDINLLSLGVLKSGLNFFIPKFEDEGDQFYAVFKNAWERSSMDLKQSVLNWIEKAAKNNTPEFIYKFTLNSIFQNKTIDEISEQRLTKTGFKNSGIWKMLFNFQQDAVLGAIDKIETYGGCIIADSVGLGKTFEALAISGCKPLKRLP